MFKVNNKDTRTTPLTPFWCLYCQFWTYFTPCSCVSLVNFEQVNAKWGDTYYATKRVVVEIVVIFILPLKIQLLVIFLAAEYLWRFILSLNLISRQKNNGTYFVAKKNFPTEYTSPKKTVPISSWLFPFTELVFIVVSISEQQI